MPLSAAPSTTDRLAIVIPDCCNLGVIFRILLVVNLAALIGMLLHSSTWRQGITEFVAISVVVELSCLWSLFLLCGARRLMQRGDFADSAWTWTQRAVCAAIPALVTGMIVYLFGSVTWLASDFAHMTVSKGVLTGALLGIFFQHYFELRTRAFSPALVEARLQALQARIRPHFFFNSLNAVLSLIRAEPRRAEATLEDLADLFRVLMSDPRSMTTLESEILLCKQYLSIEKVRLGDRLQVSWHNDNINEDVMRKAQLPVLLLQPLVENAVHYGVEPATESVPVQIHLSRSLERIEIVVVNPYHPHLMPATGNHMALANIRERLALLYDVEAQLTTTIAHGLFEVRLRFPYEKRAT